jgi:Zn-dependent protease
LVLGSFQQIGPEIPLILVLMALFGLRARVNVGVSLFVKASPERLWEIVNPTDGKTDNWGRINIVSRRIEGPGEIYEMTYSGPGAGGAVRSFQAKFGVSEREPLRRLVMVREGLQGRSVNNELLEIHHEIMPVTGGSRLSTRYVWGPRLLLAQLLARTDLWGGAYRLKGLAETGKPDEKAYFWINMMMALVTGLMTLVTFGFMLGMNFAIILVLALVVHEFGHLLAFRLVGQPWGRLVFLPFLGAVAVPRLPFESQAQSVFSALMGPGISAVMALLCLIPLAWGWHDAALFAIIGIITAGLNVFNMLPAEPLDGGVALRSVLARIMGAQAWLGLMALGVAIAIAGYFTGQLVLMLFGGLAVLANLRARKIDTGLAPLSTLQVCIAIFGYVAIAAAHYTLLFRFFDQIGV